MNVIEDNHVIEKLSATTSDPAFRDSMQSASKPPNCTTSKVTATACFAAWQNRLTPPDQLFQRSDGEDGLLATNSLPVFPEFRPVFAGAFEQ